MKKLISLLLTFAMLFALGACTEENDSVMPSTSATNPTNSTNSIESTNPSVTNPSTTEPTNSNKDEENTTTADLPEWDKLTASSERSELEAWLPLINEIVVVEQEDCTVYYNSAKTFLFIDRREEREPTSIVFTIKKIGNMTVHENRQSFYAFLVRFDYSDDSSSHEVTVNPGTVTFIELEPYGWIEHREKDLDFDSLLNEALGTEINTN